MREAAAIADAAIMRAEEVLHPGTREADAMAEIAKALARGVNGKPGTSFASMYFCSSPRTGTCHIPWSEDVIRDGSQINVSSWRRPTRLRCGDHAHFLSWQATDRLRRINEAEIAGLNAALDTVRPGGPAAMSPMPSIAQLKSWDSRRSSDVAIQ